MLMSGSPSHFFQTRLPSIVRTSSSQLSVLKAMVFPSPAPVPPTVFFCAEEPTEMRTPARKRRTPLIVGLVDTLGGLRTAFRLALERAHYAPDQTFTVERFPKSERKFLERLLQSWIQDQQDDPSSAAGLASAPGLSPVLGAWIEASAFPVGRTLALMPFSISIR